MDELPLDYNLNYQFSFYIKNNSQEDGWEHLYSSTHETTIQRNHYNYEIEKYDDIGKRFVYDSYDFIHNQQHLVDDNDCVTIQCHLRAIPKVVVLPYGYNSKVETGMVGLQNLGATCYLNALLQVNIILC